MGWGTVSAVSVFRDRYGGLPGGRMILFGVKTGSVGV